MTKKIFYGICTFVCILIFNQAFSQKIVTGVIRENNSPAASATVLVKGTTVGTKTDANGAFSILVPAGGRSLVISSVGFETQEVDISGKNTVEVNLATVNNTLNEVVVTGIGIKSKGSKIDSGNP